MNEPIKLKAHSLIDYGFFAVGFGGPVALGLRGPARTLPMTFAASQGMLNAFTNQPYAIKRMIPFRLHGRLESLAVPGLALAAFRSGAFQQRRGPVFLSVLLASLVTVYALTDWDAEPLPR